MNYYTVPVRSDNTFDFTRAKKSTRTASTRAASATSSTAAFRVGIGCCPRAGHCNCWSSPGVLSYRWSEEVATWIEDMSGACLIRDYASIPDQALDFWRGALDAARELNGLEDGYVYSAEPTPFLHVSRDEAVEPAYFWAVFKYTADGECAGVQTLSNAPPSMSPVNERDTFTVYTPDVGQLLGDR